MKKGFTLIELLATIVILGIIATITVPIMIDKIDYFNEKAYQNMISSIENATEQYVNDNRWDLDELNKFGYMNVKIKDLVQNGYLEGNLINPKTDISLSLEDVIYVTLDYKGKIDVYYDDDQKNKARITLKGPNVIKVKLNGTYTELGAIAQDKNGLDISGSISITGTVDTSQEKTYIKEYSVSDSIVLKRYVIVTSDFPKDDTEPPVLSSNVSNDYIETTKGVSFTMPVVTATDNVDSSRTINTTDTVNINNTGTYYLKYNATDSSGNKAETLIIKVVVKP